MPIALAWILAKKAGGFILRCKLCLYVLATAVLCAYVAIHVHRAEVAKCEARIEEMRQAAEIARQQRDAEVKADLEQTFKPQISTLAEQRDALQEKVKEYAKRKPVAKADVKAGTSCKLGDAAGLLRPFQSR